MSRSPKQKDAKEALIDAVTQAIILSDKSDKDAPITLDATFRSRGMRVRIVLEEQ